MWSDVVYRAEQLHLLRVLFWGALSVLSGTALLLLVVVRLRSSSLVRQFAIQCLAWGSLELVLAGWAYRGLSLRDVAGSARLERAAWLALGLYAGVVAVGVTIGFAAARLNWRGRSTVGADGPGSASERTIPSGYALSGIGTGIGIALQGLALAVLQLLFVAALSR